MNARFWMVLVGLVLLGLALFTCSGDGADDSEDDDANDDNHDGLDDDATADDDAGDDDAGDDDTTLADGPGGFAADYKTSPDFFTLMNGLVLDELGVQVQIWYSTNIQPLINDNAFSVPKGTTAIQDVDTNMDNIVDLITVMVKMDDAYDPENRNWYYEVRDVDGTLRFSPAPGRIQSCIDCHRSFAVTDFLAGTDLR